MQGEGGSGVGNAGCSLPVPAASPGGGGCSRLFRGQVGSCCSLESATGLGGKVMASNFHKMQHIHGNQVFTESN